MRNVLLVAALMIASGAVAVHADVKKRTPFDLEAHNIAFAVDALVREKGWAHLDLSSTEAVFRALIDARALDVGGPEKESLIKRKSERFRVIANSEAVCVVDLQKDSTEHNGPLVLYFAYRFNKSKAGTSSSPSSTP